MSETEGQTTPSEKSYMNQSHHEALAGYGKVESKVPGRMRLRLKPELRTPEAMAQIQESLNKHDDVSNVTINPRTGSVVFNHDKKREGHWIFREALEEVELVAGAVFELPEEEDGEGQGEQGGGGRFGKLDQQLADLIYKVDYAVWRKTGLRFRGQIVSGLIAGAGIAQILIFGISLETLPGPVLIWVAWDVYHRAAKEPPFTDPAQIAVEQTESSEESSALAPAVA